MDAGRGRLSSAGLIALACCMLLGGIAAGVYLARSFADRETWPWLRQVDPTLAVLRAPASLLNIASTFVGPPNNPRQHPFERQIMTRHEALRALLLLQESQFNVQIGPVRPCGTLIDHEVVEAVPSGNPQRVRFLATPSRKAEMNDKFEGEMWAMEFLEFEKSGKLRSRTAYHQ